MTDILSVRFDRSCAVALLVLVCAGADAIAAESAARPTAAASGSPPPRSQATLRPADAPRAAVPGAKAGSGVTSAASATDHGRRRVGGARGSADREGTVRRDERGPTNTGTGTGVGTGPN